MRRTLCSNTGDAIIKSHLRIKRCFGWIYEFKMGFQMLNQIAFFRVTGAVLCFAMAGCVTVNNIKYGPTADAEKKVGILRSGAFNIVHNASGLCATIIQSGSEADAQPSYDLVLTPCREGALSQTFVQDPLTSQIRSPAVPGTCLASVSSDSSGTPRGRVYMKRCTQRSAPQGWKFSHDPARTAFYDRMVLDASDPINVNGRPSWLGFPLKTWGAPGMTSPNLDFSQRPIAVPEARP